MLTMVRMHFHIFDIEDVAKELSDKLVHRHPHVFGNQKVSSTAEILENWDKLKKEEKTYRLDFIKIKNFCERYC